LIVAVTRRLEETPIRVQLLACAIVPCVIALLFVTLGGFVFDRREFHRSHLQALESSANLIGLNARAALQFEDLQGARDVLSAFQDEPNIEVAGIYDRDGKTFAAWSRLPESTVLPRLIDRSGKEGWAADSVWILRPIVHDSETIGWIYVSSNTSALDRRIEMLVGMTVLALIASLSLAFAISLVLQRIISRPILDLAHVSAAVTTSPDRSMRARPAGMGEMGRLVRAFNGMLDEIASQTRAIEQSRSHLEETVDARTRELVETNRELGCALEKACAADRAKSDFVATMSHELRTPMNGIIGMNEILLGTRLDDDQRTFAEATRNSADVLLGILNDILDFSKIESGKLELLTDEVDVREVTASVLELVAPLASEKGLEIGAVIASDVPHAIAGDRGRIRQVLTNLIGNAVKFTERGSVALRAHVVPGAGHPDLRFDVIDTGIGISETARAKLFQPFSQADSSHSRRYGGTGLGLVISRRLIEIMDGTIAVESTAGKGSTFSFTLPHRHAIASPERSPEISKLKVIAGSPESLSREVLATILATYFDASSVVVETGAALLDRIREAEASGAPFRAAITDEILEISGLPVPQIVLRSLGRTSPPGVRSSTKPIHYAKLVKSVAQAVWPSEARRALHPDASESSAETSPKGAHVLLAEDNAVNRMVAQRYLQKMGVDVSIAENGRIAADMATASTYDLILMDCQMPVMDGFEATRVIRAAARARVPVIALTANAMQGDRERCIASGMDDYLAKPIRPAELEHMVKKWVGRDP
jgi:signal transduction histidine kinase/CheY-like chemotaxis protein